MSLLIKALEQAARQREGRPGRASTRSVQPPPVPAEPLSLVPTGAEPPASAPQRPVAGTGPASRPEADPQRAQAASMLAAGDAGSPVLDYLRGNPVVAIGAAALLVGAVYGIYVYLQLSHPALFVRDSVRASGPAAPPTPPPLAPALVPPLPDAAPLAATPPAAAPEPAAFPGSVGLAAAPPAPSPPAVQDGRVPESLPAPPPMPAGEPIPTHRVIVAAGTAELPPAVERAAPAAPARELRAAPPEARAPRAGAAEASPPRGVEPRPAAPPAAERISISAGNREPALHPQVDRAYAALQAGRLADARALYHEVAEAEPLNVDALLGLAYIATQEQRGDEAVARYVRILQIEPRHAVAQAALIGLMGRADPAASETRLKQLIAAEPSAFLHFVLGNLYADQQLWPQAQQAYFQAHHLEPSNPDYAYNLAVGLDHLRQRKLALTYYRRAAELAAGRAQVNFSLAHARERIASLSAQLD